MDIVAIVQDRIVSTWTATWIDEVGYQTADSRIDEEKVTFYCEWVGGKKSVTLMYTTGRDCYTLYESTIPGVTISPEQDKEDERQCAEIITRTEALFPNSIRFRPLRGSELEE